MEQHQHDVCGPGLTLPSRGRQGHGPVLQLRRIGMTSGLAIGTVGRAASGVASRATMVTGLLWA